MYYVSNCFAVSNVVRVSPTGHIYGGLAQLGEHLPYKQRVGGSIPSASTISFLNNDAGWSSPVARRAHNPKAAGSNPAPAIILSNKKVIWNRGVVGLTCLPVTQEIAGSNPVGSAIFIFINTVCGSGSAVEHRLAKARVAGSIPVFRSNICALSSAG